MSEAKAQAQAIADGFLASLGDKYETQGLSSCECQD